ncbi:MAG: nickel-responsive transcriptional regulator NikR [Thermodesulfobacteriota bacterium]|nr:MAG: nickel-responsive transcriptional regulator NikR [Thermodesulfobacteriota bacterium]
MSIKRFGVSLDNALLKRFDTSISRKGYANRSEAIRDLIRDSLVQEEWKDEDGVAAVGTVTIIYSHHSKELQSKLTEMQHRHHASVISTMHIHLDAHNCLEVLVVRGAPREVRSIAESLMSVKGVKHGKFTATTSGKGLK